MAPMKLPLPIRAVLVTALTLCVLPAAAQAGVVEEKSDGTLQYRAANGETNSLLVTDAGSSVAVQDTAGVTTRTPLCAQVSTIRVQCALGIRFSEAQLGDRNDSASIRTTQRAALVDGGLGDDLFFAGMAPAASVVEYRGNHGTDTVSYASASAGAVMVQDDIFNDGRPSVGDRDNARRDVEVFIGSPFGDRLEGSPTGLVQCVSGCRGTTVPQRFTGGAGDDIVRGGLNMDQHFMGGGADGADTIIPGPSFSIVDYGGRALPVEVTIGHGTRDDGAAGERDDVRAGIDELIGGRGGDTLTQDPASDAFIYLVGGQGVDTLTGGRGGDTIDGGPGSGENLLGREGNDQIFARDGEFDLVGCGSGTGDTAELDGSDAFSGCENRPVGKLRLASKAVRAKAGEVARLELRWRHPEAWRKLAKVELRLLDGGRQVGEVVLRPAGKRMAADGAVALVRKASRMRAAGKAVVARLALKLDAGLAGRKLRLDVEATGRDGSRQVERAAGTIRVAR
jgi:Ca2+-binding RTX toxin-like protein